MNLEEEENALLRSLERGSASEAAPTPAVPTEEHFLNLAPLNVKVRQSPHHVSSLACVKKKALRKK